MVNLTAGDGHLVEIMDLTFSVQALCAAQRGAEELAQLRSRPRR